MPKRKPPHADPASPPSDPKPTPPPPPPGDDSDPKTTHPPAESQREPEAAVTTDQSTAEYKLDAHPDRVDIRDWFYQPRLAPLPDKVINCHLVPDILDQGGQGACTGYALASVVNFLLHARKLKRRVSPRMIYEMARRYDDWPGEGYEGSTARGAMIGWAKHGACHEKEWPPDIHGPEHFTQRIEDDAQKTPGGAFYRVMHRQIRDMHAALNEVGILYVTLMVHRGWFNPGYDEAGAGPRQVVKIDYDDKDGNALSVTLPIIRRIGRADSGHAVAIVGYTHRGFVIQNSWGLNWGGKEGGEGFALLPYEDYLLHACDVWVAQLGVPVAMNLWAEEGACDTSAGLQRAARSIPLNDIRPYIVDIGNDGELSLSGDYWTTEQDLQRMFADTIPKRMEGGPRKG